MTEIKHQLFNRARLKFCGFFTVAGITLREEGKYKFKCITYTI